MLYTPSLINHPSLHGHRSFRGAKILPAFSQLIMQVLPRVAVRSPFALTSLRCIRPPEPPRGPLYGIPAAFRARRSDRDPWPLAQPQKKPARPCGALPFARSHFHRLATPALPRSRWRCLGPTRGLTRGHCCAPQRDGTPTRASTRCCPSSDGCTDGHVHIWL